MSKDQLVPHSVEAEQQLLGAVLANNERFHEVSAFLKPEHFYDPVHAQIWKIAGQRIERGKLEWLVAKGILPKEVLL